MAATEVGVSLSIHPPEEQFALVKRVEALGFDSVWTGDHISFHNPMYESLALLSAYASITQCTAAPTIAGARSRSPRAMPFSIRQPFLWSSCRV